MFHEATIAAYQLRVVGTSFTRRHTKYLFKKTISGYPSAKIR
jgi:hypothetical protein